MKQGIHPQYMECTVRCSCGNTWVTRATKPEMRLDLCDKCHPFYTGTQKLVDTGGRVQRFADKFGSAAQARLDAAAAKAKAAKAEKAAAAEAARKAAAEAKAAEKARRAAEFEKKAAEAPAVEEAPAEEAFEDRRSACNQRARMSTRPFGAGALLIDVV